MVFDKLRQRLHQNNLTSQKSEPAQEPSDGAFTGTGHHQHGPNHPAATGAAAGAGLGAAEHLREDHKGERTGGRHDGIAGNHPTAEGAVAGAGLGAGVGAAERHHERRENRDAQGYNTAGKQGAYDSAGTGQPVYGSAADTTAAQGGGTMGHTGGGHMGAAGAVGGGALGVGAGEAMAHPHGGVGAGNTAPGAGQYDTAASGYNGQASSLTPGAVRAGEGAPAGAGYGTNAGTGGGTGQQIMGRVEQAIGVALGSDTMKAQGLEKERVGLVKQDMNEAQRLETQAGHHRDRAAGRGPVGTGGLGGY